jgi:hypothetical protein
MSNSSSHSTVPQTTAKKAAPTGRHQVRQKCALRKNRELHVDILEA